MGCFILLSNSLPKIKNVFSRTITKIILVLCFPMIILLVFAFISSSYHVSNFKSQIISNYSNELNSFLRDTEEKMVLIINTSTFIAENPNINYMLTTTNKPTQAEALSSTASLRQATSLNDIIDSVIIYNKSANFVISPSGVYDSSLYFDMKYSYNNYSSAYWTDYHSVSGNAKFLAPTVVHNTDSTVAKTIVPLVFTSVGHIYSNNLVIFNIDMNALFEKFETHRLTPNSTMYMMDNTSGNIYSDSSFSETNTDEYTFLYAVKNTFQSNMDVVSANKEKYLLIRSTERFNSWGYTYFVAVPYKDINASAIKPLLFSCVFILILFILLTVFCFYGTRYLYTPWKELFSIVKNSHTPEKNIDSGNISNYVMHSFMNISDINKNLQQNLEATLPLSQEKYLIDILSENTNIDTSDDVLSPLSFSYDYFSAIAIKIIINPDFFINQDINISDSIMHKKIKKVLRGVFSNKFITYELPSSNDILYLLLNTENDDYYTELIKETIDEIENLLNADNDNLKILFGIGGIYQGIDGLKLTHKEAISSLTKTLNSCTIQFSITENEPYVFSQSSENVLTNYLTGGLMDKAKQFIENIFSTIDSETTVNKRQVYCDIILSLRKIMRQKGMVSADFSTENLINLIQNTNDLSEDEIKAQIFNIIDTVFAHMKTHSNKISIEDVILYVNEHFTESLTLDELAEKYNTSPKYLSNRIKQYLNMPFKDYITQLKIEKAKEYLCKTNISITELYPLVGFMGRGAFTRAFKQKTGLSPSEYKKLYNKGKTDIE